MNRYAVFLRGVNVGGITVRMADLRAALQPLPLANVSTLLATGNIVCSAELTVGQLKELIEDCLRKNFGYDAWVVVLPAVRLAELIDACPWPPDSPQTHTYVTLSSDPGVLDDLYTAAAADPSVEQARLGPEATAWLAPVGGTLESPFSKVSARPKYKSATTTRNLRTLVKVRDAAAKLGGPAE